MQLVCVTRRRRRAFADVFAGSAVDPDRQPERFRLGMDCWVVQTALRLQGAAPWLTVRLADRCVPGAVNLVHRDETHWWRGPATCFTLVVRADRPPVLLGDRVIVQNPAQAGGRAIHLPHWPQPGLIARDPARGDRLKVVAFRGRARHLPAAFRSADFTAALAALGMRLVIDEQDWHDYRQVDAVLALRSDPPAMIASKPASKLANAWLAGVPALLGPEPAYRQLGRPGRDYLEVADPADVLAVLRRLRAEPARYRALRAAGARRRPEVDVAAVRRAWLSALAGPLCPAPGAWRPRRWVLTAARAARQRRLARRWREDA